MARHSGRFIVLEGPDKSGKSTQAKKLVAYLTAGGVDKVIRTREPGGTTLAESIRKILLTSKHAIDPMAELFLYEAARAQHTREKLLPRLKAGWTVVSERYTLATLAYQGYGRNIPLPIVRKLNKIASEGLEPDLTFLITIPDKQFTARTRKFHDRLEREAPDFRSQVRRGYRELAKKQTKKIVVIDGTLSKSAIHKKIVSRVKKILA